MSGIRVVVSAWHAELMRRTIWFLSLQLIVSTNIENILNNLHSSDASFELEKAILELAFKLARAMVHPTL